jgi:hypothetical protein
MINNQLVTFNMATMPERLPALRDTVNSILPQCDLLNIYLNRFDEIPEFLKHPKIKTYLGKDHRGDMGDVGKFYKVSGQKGYIFTVDDKILYPSDYVAKMVRTIERTGRKAVVSNHGRNFHTNRKSSSYYFDCAQTFMYSLAYPLTFVHEIGTGVLAFHSSTIRPCLKWFPNTNMTDIYFSIACQKRDIPLIIHPHAKDWIRLGNKHDENFSIHAFCNRNDGFQTQVINEFEWRILTCQLDEKYPVRKDTGENRNVTISGLDCTIISGIHDLAIVIPVFNNLRFTKSICENLLLKTSCNFTLIIIDDASTDETREYIQRLNTGGKAKVIYHRHDANKGVNTSWNEGIQIARSIGSKYIAILNNDLELSMKWDLPLSSSLMDLSVGIVSPYSTHGNRLHVNFPFAGSINPLGMDILGCCFMFRADLIDRIGYIPEELFHYFGDNWFSEITKQAGLEVVYVPESRIHHYFQQTTGLVKQSAIVDKDRKCYETLLNDGLHQHIHFK